MHSGSHSVLDCAAMGEANAELLALTRCFLHPSVRGQPLAHRVSSEDRSERHMVSERSRGLPRGGSLVSAVTKAQAGSSEQSRPIRTALKLSRIAIKLSDSANDVHQLISFRLIQTRPFLRQSVYPSFGSIAPEPSPLADLDVHNRPHPTLGTGRSGFVRRHQLSDKAKGLS